VDWANFIKVPFKSRTPGRRLLASSRMRPCNHIGTWTGCSKRLFYGIMFSIRSHTLEESFTRRLGWITLDPLFLNAGHELFISIIVQENFSGACRPRQFIIPVRIDHHFGQTSDRLLCGLADKLAIKSNAV